MAKTQKREIGDLGEGIVCRYLENKGYVVIERNYLRKWGEIDIVATKAGILHFVEVKSVTRESSEDVSRGTLGHSPEENVHPEKLRKITKVAEYYLNELVAKGDGRESQIDVIAVYLDLKIRKAKCKHIQNVL